MRQVFQLKRFFGPLIVIAFVVYACAQAPPQAPTAPVKKPLIVAEPSPPQGKRFEGPTDLPHPGPPFSKHNRDGNVVLKDFPVDQVGNVDWVKALTEKKITPWGSLDGKKREMPPFPLNVDIPAVGAMPDVVFPHGPHTMWLQCGNCHPGIFIMKKGANPISMVKIVNGQYCGRCHGRVAFPLANCERCHVKPKEVSSSE